MATIISLCSADANSSELIAEAFNDPTGFLKGNPVAIRMALKIRRQGGKVLFEEWNSGGDPRKPTIILSEKVINVGTPRLDAISKFKRYWNTKVPKYGVNALPKVDINEVCALEDPIIILQPRFEPGNVSALELVVLNHLVKKWQPNTFFEIGTFDGRSTINICANAAPGAQGYTLDLPPNLINETVYKVESNERKFIEKEQSGHRFAGTEFEKRIEKLYGDSAAFDFSEYYGKIDLVFVDASHAKENVLSDAKTALNLLRRDRYGDKVGAIIFHDYGEWEGVTEALEELALADIGFERLTRIADTTFAIIEFPNKRLTPLLPAQSTSRR